MQKTNKEIRANYALYEELLRDVKIVFDSRIYLEDKPSNAKWLLGESIARHPTLSNALLFCIESSKRDRKYGIKLKCDTLSKEPFFRFDSDGPAHRNDHPGLMLGEQQITTPHFNSYRPDGKPFAYKNDVLKRSGDAKAIVNDINLGADLFCRESLAFLANGNVPQISFQTPEIPFGGEHDTNFDNIDFI